MKVNNKDLNEADAEAFASVMRLQDPSLQDDFDISFAEGVIDVLGPLWNPKNNVFFDADPTSPNIMVGSNGARIIKSPSGKFRVYSVTGTLLGIRDTEQAAKKLATN